MGKREMKEDVAPKRARTKKKAGAMDIVLRVLMIVCIVAIVVSGAYLGWYFWEAHSNTAASEEAADQFVKTVTVEVPTQSEESSTSVAEVQEEETFTVDFEALQAASPYAKGWIRISGLDVVDYPVVWYTDDDYFLNHAWDGASSRYGAIFMEAANTPDFSDCYTIIYGHNMKNGSMFGSLKKYQNKSFFDENGGKITICLPGETRTYQIFAARYADPADQSVYMVGFAHDETFGNYLQNIKNNSLYNTGVEVSQDDNVIMLSTCANGGTSRFVVHAKLVESVVVE